MVHSTLQMGFMTFPRKKKPVLNISHNCLIPRLSLTKYCNIRRRKTVFNRCAKERSLQRREHSKINNTCRRQYPANKKKREFNNKKFQNDFGCRFTKLKKEKKNGKFPVTFWVVLVNIKLQMTPKVIIKI